MAPNQADTELILPAFVSRESLVVFPRMSLPVAPEEVSDAFMATPPPKETGPFLVALIALDNDKPLAVTDWERAKKSDFTGVVAQYETSEAAGQVRVVGLRRVKITKLGLAEYGERKVFRASIEEYPTPQTERDAELDGYYIEIRESFMQLLNRAFEDDNIIGDTKIFNVINADLDTEDFLDQVTIGLQRTFAKDGQFHGYFYEILQAVDQKQRAEMILNLISRIGQHIAVSRKIARKMHEKMSSVEREAVLREQMRTLEKELNDINGTGGDEASNYRAKLEAIENMSEEVKERVEKEINRFAATPTISPENGILRNYLELIFSLPWDESTDDKIDIAVAEQVLNEDHYGLEKIKERILEFLAVRQINPKSKSPILCFVGPPGVGKTSLGKSIARAMNRNFSRFSLGGVHDEAEIRGHRRTYVGALPGRIIRSIKEAKSNNPIIMLDEIDKLGADFRGDPSSALLEVLDPEQNSTFSDNYLELHFDLSKTLFITTANTLESIPGPLRDRMEIIRIPGYTEQEKVQIARGYLWPEQLAEHGLSDLGVEISDEMLNYVVSRYTREAGVRNLEREIARICRKLAKKVASKEALPDIDRESIQDMLGPERFSPEALRVDFGPGEVNGLAWTELGGEILVIEAAAVHNEDRPSEEAIVLTGSLGKVMQESARTAYTVARRMASAEKKDSFFKNRSFHLHVPSGAVPKDGPSAGVAMTLALWSAITETPVIPSLAMTGEITLVGKVLPIGGLKEKLIAAYNAGVRKVLIPQENVKDLIDVPEEIRSEMDITPIAHFNEAILAAIPKPKIAEETADMLSSSPVAQASAGM